MLGASYQQLNAEFGFAFTLRRRAAAGALRRASSTLIERSYGRYLGLLQAWRLASAGFMEQFQRMLLSKLRVVFENAAGEIELWSKAASAQIEQQLRERRRAFTHRHEALQRIQSAAGELEQRIAEVEQQDKRLAGLQWRLDALVEQALAAAAGARPMRRPPRRERDRAVAQQRALMPAAGDIAQRVLRWRRQFGRQGLPWQDTRDPYRVWLSEIMLQQTQVATVLDYYARFLQRFPDVARAGRRAAGRRAGAVERPGLLQPRAQPAPLRAGGAARAWRRASRDSSQALAQLPGIGRSTAAAIAAFCFGERVAILDGNVKRVLGRALGFAGDLSQAAQRARAVAAGRRRWCPQRGVEHYTQGLMDLGATLCSARRPAASAARWPALCVARREGRPEAYPVKTRRLQRGARAHALAVAGAGPTRLWLVQRPEHGVWAGLWSLPEFDTPDALQQRLQGWPGQRRGAAGHRTCADALRLDAAAAALAAAGAAVGARACAR